MRKIVVIGEILVEIMADTQGEGFMSTQALTGPFPSGAPAIFIDQVARLGQPCAIISSVGDDDFGRINLQRLAGDGVDISAVAISPDRPTGTAFVRYRPSGSRDFVFNIRHSACGLIPKGPAVAEVLRSAGHLHIMGSSLSSRDLVDLNLAAAREVKGRGGSISFDPNLRKEILDSPGMRDAMDAVLAMTDLFLPSGDEIMLLTHGRTAEDAAKELLRRGVKAVVHKLGARGVRYFDGQSTLFIPPFSVEELDPTGAGDCFGAAFTTFWLRGLDPEKALVLASAAGALAVTKRGPMEGASDLDTLIRFAATQPRRRV